MWNALIRSAKHDNYRLSIINLLMVPNVKRGWWYSPNAIPNRMIFTDEANLDAEKFTRNKKNFLNLVGQNIRVTERDFVQSIYSLSKPPTQISLDDLN